MRTSLLVLISLSLIGSARAADGSSSLPPYLARAGAANVKAVPLTEPLLLGRYELHAAYGRAGRDGEIHPALAKHLAQQAARLDAERFRWGTGGRIFSVDRGAAVIDFGAWSSLEAVHPVNGSNEGKRFRLDIVRLRW